MYAQQDYQRDQRGRSADRVSMNAPAAGRFRTSGVEVVDVNQ
jgi:hypothetical protein